MNICENCKLKAMHFLGIGFLLAYILPRFGEPQKLRPGDSIYIIPEKEQEL